MTNIPFIPETAPFTPEQRAWLNGFLAGLFSNAGAAGAPMPQLPAGHAANAEPLMSTPTETPGFGATLQRSYTASADNLSSGDAT